MSGIIDKIGFLSPLLLFIITVFHLFNQKKYLLSYLVFFTCNTIVNKILKNIIKQKRPDNGIRIMNEEYNGVEKYGMPSGHAQSCFFSLTFLYLVKGSPAWLIIELFIGLVSLYQRFKYKQHTVEQLLVGSILGIIFAYFSFSITKQWLSVKTLYPNNI